jgi:glycosyltransferase involved in cell wall biosynthesis
MTAVDRTPSSFTVEVEPEVTVVVTAHNREELIATALKSVQLQRFTAWECIVVDDGSSDGTVEIARQFTSLDQRFRVIVHEESQGLAAARNTGIKSASARTICFLDDDDFLLADSLETRLTMLDSCPLDVAGTFCDWINTDPEVGLEVFDKPRRPTRRGTITFATLRRGTPFIATAPLIRTSIVSSVGGFDETYRRAEDAELWARLLRGGYRFVDAGHVGVAYRRTPTSMVLTDPAAQLETLMEIASRLEEPNPRPDWGPDPSSERLADLALAAERAPTIYRYLALVAVADFDAAVERGVALLPKAVRYEIDHDLLAPQLGSYVRTRLAIADPIEGDRINAIAMALATALIPNSTTSPTVDSKV